MSAHSLRIFFKVRACIVAVILPLVGCASFPDLTDMSRCDNTPDSPAKHTCAQHMVSSIKGTLFSYQLIDNGDEWADNYFRYADYLGVHDKDYARMLELRATIYNGKQYRAQHYTPSDNGYGALAGYYRALGPKWNQYAAKAQEVANFVAGGGAASAEAQQAAQQQAAADLAQMQAAFGAANQAQIDLISAARQKGAQQSGPPRLGSSCTAPPHGSCQPRGCSWVAGGNGGLVCGQCEAGCNGP
jgi:hypothetical protein